MNRHYLYDVLIIGSGAAGLCLALNLAKQLKVAVICKNAVSEGSTYYAQGGIAAVLDEQDSIESHVKDTMIAGGGLCSEDAVRFTVENAKAAINWLTQQGVQFDKGDNQQTYHLTREGGHSHRRIVHSADATGKAVSGSLIEQASAEPNITFFEYHIAIDLIKQNNRCTGAYILDQKRDIVDSFQAKFVVLATGGASKVYLYSSNPDGNSGDGMAMAWRAGCRIANMEFNQFHPTCLYNPQGRTSLMTEALRGEGALLKLPNGERFMPQHDERAELAPRDVVARAIDHEMKRLGLDHVYLDISHKPASFIHQHFPNIYQSCLDEIGIDITKEAIPVVPAAHYTCGGIIIDKNGNTDLAGLLAIGETTCTGLHGANRMASNSLLECLVYARSSAEYILQHHQETPAPIPAPSWDASRVTTSEEDITISHSWHELRQVMWDYVGIVRSDKRLARALARISLIKKEVNDYYRDYHINSDLIELRNLVLVAEIIVRSAISRKESRGLHYTLDYPELLPQAKDTILSPPDFQLN